MKLGDVLKKERERKGLSADQVARDLGIEAQQYVEVEAGDSAEFEAAAALIANFAKVIKQPISSLYYPCGIPFQEVQDYDVRVIA